MKKQLILTITMILSGMIVCNSIYAQYSLYVGEHEYIPTPDPPNNGWLYSANWTCDGDIAFVERDRSGAIIYPSHYYEGSATVTVNYNFGYYVAGKETISHLQKTFYISCIPVDGKLSETQLYMTIGQKKTLKYTPSNSDYYSYTSKHATWESSDEDIVTVDKNGEVEAISSGHAVITYDPVGGPLLFCNVTVEYIEPTSISINEKNVSIVEGKTKTLTYTLEPKGASASVTWTSSDEGIAKVSSIGKVTGVSEGKATITATTEKGLSANCTVEVVPAPKAVSLPSRSEVYQGYNIQLMPTLTPSNSESTYKWKSEDTSIASVSSDGKVKGRTIGTTTITVTTENGLTATTSVVVKESPQGADYRNSIIRIEEIKKHEKETLEYINF